MANTWRTQGWALHVPEFTWAESCLVPTAHQQLTTPHQLSCIQMMHLTRGPQSR